MKIRSNKGSTEESAKDARKSLRDFSPASGLKSVMSTCAFLPRMYIQTADNTGQRAFLSRTVTAYRHWFRSRNGSGNMTLSPLYIRDGGSRAGSIVPFISGRSGDADVC